MRKGEYTPAPRTRCPSDAEYAAVYASAGERLQIAMDLALLTGLRKGGLLRLELADVTDDGLLCRRPGKTTKPLLFEWTPDLRAVVDRAKKLEPRVRRALLCTSKCEVGRRAVSARARVCGNDPARVCAQADKGAAAP